MTAGLETFAKVRALHDATASPDERASAAVRMRTLARKAGLTVEQAVSRLDAPLPKTPAQAAADAFNALFNRPEALTQRAEQDRQRQVRRAEILACYGCFEGVYAETAREAALRVACEPMTVWPPQPEHAQDYTLDGWGCLSRREKVPPRVRTAVAAGWPLPGTVAEAWAEFIAAKVHEHDRQTMHDYEHFPALWAEVRRYVLEDLLDTLPARSPDDVRARLDWMQHVIDLGFSRGIEEDTRCLATLRADIERVGLSACEREAGPVQNGQEAHTGRVAPLTSPDPETSAAPVHSGRPRRPTRAERHAAIRALLAEGLADREIARRLAISPTTVGAVRRAAGSAP